MRLFDTHAHLNDEQFENELDEVIQRARQAGVTSMIAVGISTETSKQCVRLAADYDGVYAAVGIQPNCCTEAAPGDWDKILELIDFPGVIALGETGLDRYWKDTPFEMQQDYFNRHLRLSQETDLPFIVHMRDCSEDILVMLREARSRGPLQGVMHSFTGDHAMAEECLDMGLYISFAGMVTFKKSQELRDIAASIPDDRILIETDSPYLSPHPMRGKRPNEPARLIHTARCLAETRGTSIESFSQQTTENAKRLFPLAK